MVRAEIPKQTLECEECGLKLHYIGYFPDECHDIVCENCLKDELKVSLINPSHPLNIARKKSITKRDVEIARIKNEGRRKRRERYYRRRYLK